MTTLQSEHYQLWKITVYLFAGFSPHEALNLNLALQIKYMDQACEYCCVYVAVFKAQVPSLSGVVVEGGFATHHPCPSLLLRFIFYKSLELCNKPV